MQPDKGLPTKSSNSSNSKENVSGNSSIHSLLLNRIRQSNKLSTPEPQTPAAPIPSQSESTNNFLRSRLINSGKNSATASSSICNQQGATKYSSWESEFREKVKTGKELSPLEVQIRDCEAKQDLEQRLNCLLQNKYRPKKKPKNFKTRDQLIQEAQSKYNTCREIVKFHPLEEEQSPSNLPENISEDHIASQGNKLPVLIQEEKKGRSHDELSTGLIESLSDSTGIQFQPSDDKTCDAASVEQSSERLLRENGLLASLLESFDSFAGAPSGDDFEKRLLILRASCLEPSEFAELMKGKTLYLTEAGKMVLEAVKKQEEPLVPKNITQTYEDQQDRENKRQRDIQENKMASKKRKKTSTSENAADVSDLRNIDEFLESCDQINYYEEEIYCDDPSLFDDVSNSSSDFYNRSPCKTSDENCYQLHTVPPFDDSRDEDDNPQRFFFANELHHLLSSDDFQYDLGNDDPHLTTVDINRIQAAVPHSQKVSIDKRKIIDKVDNSDLKIDKVDNSDLKIDKVDDSDLKIDKVVDNFDLKIDKVDNSDLKAVRGSFDVQDTCQLHHLTEEEFVILNGKDGNGPIMIEVTPGN